jgi:hypothetical protein
VEEKQAALRILAINLDTNTPTGRLLLNLVGKRCIRRLHEALCIFRNGVELPFFLAQMLESAGPPLQAC